MGCQTPPISTRSTGPETPTEGSLSFAVTAIDRISTVKEVIDAITLGDDEIVARWNR